MGQATAKNGLGLGMKVIAADSFYSKVDVKSRIFLTDVNHYYYLLTITRVIVLEADFITLHVPAPRWIYHWREL
jgi:D-3-phosphoglycerate dehydrogenase